MSSPEDVWRYVSDADGTNRVIVSRSLDDGPIEDDAPTAQWEQPLEPTAESVSAPPVPLVRHLLR